MDLFDPDMTCPKCGGECAVSANRVHFLCLRCGAGNPNVTYQFPEHLFRTWDEVDVVVEDDD
jgi:hypothetical protein